MCCPDNCLEIFKKGAGEKIYNEVVKTMKSYQMDKMVENGLIVGFSGGADSMLLLLFLLEYRRRNNLNFNITAVHVNHMIRGAEADEDMQFSAEISKALGVDYVSEKVDVPQLADEMSVGLEEAARCARYRIFEGIISGRNDVSFVAVAHNATDNLETVIFNMMRGSGLPGVCGIPPVRGNIIRPLLHISKEDIVLLLSEYNIPYRIDSTNSDVAYTRNYIRAVVAPTLKSLSPSPESSIARLTSALIADNDYLLSAAENIFNTLWNNKYIAASVLRELHYSMFVRVINLASQSFASVSLDSVKINSLHSMLDSDNFRYSIGNGYCFICQRGMCAFVNDEEFLADERVFELKYGTNFVDDYDACIVIGEVDTNSSLNVYKYSINTTVPSAIINGSLRFRFRRDGDSYRYGGMTRKLKKVFNDRNISPIDRERIPIIFDDTGILWVPGLCPRDSAESESECARVKLAVYYNDRGEGGFTTAYIRNQLK